MDITNLPPPVSNIKNEINNFEDFLNLKMIDLLWFLCPQQRQYCIDNLNFKINFLNYQKEKKPHKEEELNKEFDMWCSKYLLYPMKN